MKYIGKFIGQIIANALAIVIASYFIVQISFTGGLVDYLIIGLVLTIANIIIKPILKAISSPLIIITFGLFIIVINAVILFAVDWFIKELIITGFWGYFWGILIISIINALIVGPSKKKN